MLTVTLPLTTLDLSDSVDHVSPLGSSAPPRQNSAGPQRRIDQPPPPSSAPPGPPRGRTPPSMLSGGGGSAYPPRPASGSMMSSSPDWPSGGQARLRQTSSSSKGDSPEKRPSAKVTRLSPRQPVHRSSRLPACRHRPSCCVCVQAPSPCALDRTAAWLLNMNSAPSYGDAEDDRQDDTLIEKVGRCTDLEPVLLVLSRFSCCWPGSLVLTVCVSPVPAGDHVAAGEAASCSTAAG